MSALKVSQVVWRAKRGGRLLRTARSLSANCVSRAQASSAPAAHSLDEEACYKLHVCVCPKAVC